MPHTIQIDARFSNIVRRRGGGVRITIQFFGERRIIMLEHIKDSLKSTNIFSRIVGS